MKRLNPETRKRLLNKTTRDGRCLIWEGATNQGGVPVMGIDGKVVGVKRYLYQFLKGNVPDNKIIVSSCGKNCINPAHLMIENWGAHNLNKTHCPQGHEYNEENTTINSVTGGRVCRTCYNAYARKWQARKKKIESVLLVKKAKKEEFDFAKRVMLNVFEKTNGCWIWKGYKTRTGHSHAYLGGKHYTVPNYMYKKFVGSLSHKQGVTTSCGTKDCVNPKHLVIVNKSTRNSKKGKIALIKRKATKTRVYG